MSAPSRTLVLRSDRLVLEVVTTGAAVRRLVLDDDGPVDLVLGHRDPATYDDDGGYLGATVGRFTNRLGGGRLVVDGTEHRVPPNDGANALHGGPVGWDRLAWEVLEEAPDRVVLGLTSPDGDQGLPGEVTARVTYEVAGDEVRLHHHATTSATTYLGMTNHAYFSLDGGPDVLEHRLEVGASAFTPVGADLLPTGEVLPVDGTPFDLRRARLLRDVLALDDEQLVRGGGLDHNLVLDGSGMRRAARLVGASGRWVEVHTDRPAVQVYTGAHFDGALTGLDGRPLLRHAGVALETQGYPDAPNHPGFPDALVRPGEALEARTTWRVGRD
ncbi:aldose epimerase family protein [Arthrobacter sp. NEB 688]|uniref:aldose epimerase family protein n=1 Tax=Arthrobacter sp. NEB 688 TaxID=904039 RepID=UPI0015650F08|nr:aldose epimerase family protein [Arthrobacter sp. NEB 688]QKE82613.1 galactose mutarotase [Arthrobacter sp. NEB 688]